MQWFVLVLIYTDTHTHTYTADKRPIRTMSSRSARAIRNKGATAHIKQSIKVLVKHLLPHQCLTYFICLLLSLLPLFTESVHHCSATFCINAPFLTRLHTTASHIFTYFTHKNVVLKFSQYKTVTAHALTWDTDMIQIMQEIMSIQSTKINYSYLICHFTATTACDFCCYYCCCYYYYYIRFLGLSSQFFLSHSTLGWFSKNSLWELLKHKPNLPLSQAKSVRQHTLRARSIKMRRWAIRESAAGISLRSCNNCWCRQWWSNIDRVGLSVINPLFATSLLLWGATVTAAFWWNTAESSPSIWRTSSAVKPPSAAREHNLTAGTRTMFYTHSIHINSPPHRM